MSTSGFFPSFLFFVVTSAAEANTGVRGIRGFPEHLAPPDNTREPEPCPRALTSVSTTSSWTGGWGPGACPISCGLKCPRGLKALGPACAAPKEASKPKPRVPQGPHWSRRGAGRGKGPPRSGPRSPAAGTQLGLRSEDVNKQARWVCGAREHCRQSRRTLEGSRLRGGNH